MAGGALKSLKVWVPIFGVVVLAFFYFLVNLGAAKSPVANTRGLPVAVVNEDTGSKLGGERVYLGSRVVESATTGEKIGRAVEWTRVGSREAAVRGISRGEYDGALIIPKNYSRSIADLAAPPELPVAIVNEDEGAKIGGKPVDLGGQVVEGATSEKKLRGVIHWSKVSGEKQAFEGFSKGEYAAAIVIPKDYSGRLASLAAPTAGKMPEPAQLRLLTNPATDPSTLSTVKQAFSGITASTSRTTGEKLSGALASALAGVLPFEHATDGIRALLFYDGRIDAGLGTDLWVLSTYLVGAVLVSGCVALLRDVLFRRQKKTGREDSQRRMSAPDAVRQS